ncbi:MAG TPA: choice-of-anchor tandem repeat GloVer-containing protein [Rhizomicrobium sp.]|nr:choice-of-anchor tandem repeat GloVer-containing protein [Rhizomicrobium sp.]
MISVSYARPAAARRVLWCVAGCLLSISGLLSGSADAKSMLKTLYLFCSQKNCTDGGDPHAGVLLDDQGNLFGTTRGGGKRGGGTVFEISGDGSESVVHSFCAGCGDGQEPNSELIRDINGALYGTTDVGGPSGGGVVFKLWPDGTGWKYKILYGFCGIQNCADGGGPVAGLTYQGAQTGAPYDGTSPLYGITYSGGSWDGGTVFQLAFKNGRTPVETVLHSFCPPQDCSDGQHPTERLVIDAAGELYGVTRSGDYDEGDLFEVSPASRTFTNLYRFCQLKQCADGSSPTGIAIDASGNPIVAVGAGGANGEGAIVRVKPKGTQSTETILYSFCPGGSPCIDGSDPQSATLAPDGNIYGTTFSGGPSGKKGTVFKLHAGKEKVLYAFCVDGDCTDGSFPLAAVILDASGRLYGTTPSGGNNDEGTVFEITP